MFIMLPRVPAWYFAMLGAIRIGAVMHACAEPAHAARRRLSDHERGAVAAITGGAGAREARRRRSHSDAEGAPRRPARSPENVSGRAMDAAGDGDTSAANLKDDPIICSSPAAR
ncbi:MAG: hypothetical protein R2736_23350 [Solirubrobacterales bacterium]